MVHYSKTPDLTGATFGMWSVIRRDGSMPYGGAAWICRCACGTEKRVSAGSLRKGDSTNCGCKNASEIGERSKTHGHYKHPLYRHWGRMKERCEYKMHPYFSRYGGRGIKVCDRWQNFQNFYDDNAASWAPGLTLERIDNDSGYSPENCVWVTQKEQNRNRSNTVKMTLHGVTKPLVAWADELGIPATRLRERRRNGWSDERALTTI